MKKWIPVVVIAVVAVGLVLGGVAYAAASAAAAPAASELAAYGRMRSQAGPGGGPDGLWPAGARDQLHDYVFQAAAEALGLSVYDLQAKLDDGQHLAQIAEEEGIGQEDLPAFMQEAWSEAVQAAVADGVLTQDQADAVLEHPGMMRLLWGGRMMRGWGARTPQGWGVFGPQ
jgi:uncharacterized protein YidB (DUF937 family)